MDNMRIYKRCEEVPDNAKKQINGGRLKGMTDINPQWRIEKLTELFGVVGFGWKIKTIKKEIIEGANGEKVAFVDVELFIKVDGEWSDGIEGSGGASFISKERNGLYTSDEAFKMAKTDATSVACKMIGIGATIYRRGCSSNNSKYEVSPPSDITPPDILEDKIKTSTGNSILTPITEKQRKCIFAYLNKKACTKEDLDDYLQNKYKKPISELNTTEASQAISFVKDLLEQSEIDKLVKITEDKGFNFQHLLKAVKKTNLKYLSGDDYQVLINRISKAKANEKKEVEVDNVSPEQTMNI